LISKGKRKAVFLRFFALFGEKNHSKFHSRKFLKHALKWLKHFSFNLSAKRTPHFSFFLFPFSFLKTGCFYVSS